MKKFKGIIISIAAALVAATAVTMPSTAYDVNNDGIVSIADAVLMQRYLLNALDDTERQSLAERDFMSNADLNNDGSVDVFDFILMRGYLVNEGIVKRNITREEFLDLLLSKEEFTWSDFEQYRSVDVGSGMYILKYEIEFEDSEDNVFLYVYGESMDKRPENIYLERCSDGETIDIYELREHLLDFFGRNITREEFLDLLLSKEEFTWSDFEQYRSVDVDLGMYILKYEIEFEDSEDNVFLYVCGESMDEKPENIYLERCSDGETIDIYELRKQLLAFLDSFKVPENSETDRNNALKIGEYAFDGLKDGSFDLKTELDYDDIIENVELAEAWHKSRFCYMEFVDEHTVKLTFHGGGFFEVFGYLITDGNVEYEIGWTENIDIDYDGGGVDIRERYDNVYFFYAGL